MACWTTSCCCAALQEVSELLIFQAVAEWCQLGAEQAPCSPHMQPGSASSPTGLVPKSSVCSSAEANRLQRNCGNAQSELGVERPPSQVLGALQLVRFALMTDAERQVGCFRVHGLVHHAGDAATKASATSCFTGRVAWPLLHTLGPSELILCTLAPSPSSIASPYPCSDDSV